MIKGEPIQYNLVFDSDGHIEGLEYVEFPIYWPDTDYEKKLDFWRKLRTYFESIVNSRFEIDVGFAPLPPPKVFLKREDKYQYAGHLIAYELPRPKMPGPYHFPDPVPTVKISFHVLVVDLIVSLLQNNLGLHVEFHDLPGNPLLVLAGIPAEPIDKDTMENGAGI